MLLGSCVVLTILLRFASGYSQLCGNKSLSCTTQILGDQGHTDHDLCQMEVYPPNSPQCGSMAFGPLVSNAYIGGVTLKPHIITEVVNVTNPFAINRTVLNITFSNIKWTTMRFRFRDKYRDTKNHCRNIVIDKDVTVDDQSVLYYDCYWPLTDARNDQSHILDFEAANQWSVYRGQYYFNIPSADMLSQAVSESEWKPFVYIEIFLTKMRLRIMPPPSHLKIRGYQIQVMKRDCGKNSPCEVKSKTVDLNNNTDEVSYDYNYVGDNGEYYFAVTPLHKKCVNGIGCRVVESPKIIISSEPQSLNICIASITALIVAALFAYYIVLRVFRRYCCKDYKLALSNEIPTPPKVLVIYSPTNRLHAECVASFVTYLRAEYGFDLMYDGDISTTSHGDPYIWAEEAFRISSHIMYIVGPAEETNLYNNIYDKPIISVHKDVDVLLLSFIKVNRVSKCPKDVLNVFFEYSNGQVPVETRHDKVFFLIKDWHKLISYLSKNLLPKRHIMRTEKGRSFLEDLTRAKKLLNVKADEVMVKCEKNAFDRKILL